MSCSISNKSNIACYEIWSLLGILLSKLTEDAEVVYFENDYEVKKYGKFDNILESIREVSCGGGTDMSLSLEYAIKNEKNINLKNLLIELYI